MRRLPVLAAALAPILTGLAVTVPAQAAPGRAAHLAPGCQRVAFQENSGNGPAWHLIVCDGMKPFHPGYRWVCVVDGGPLVNHAVVFCTRQPVDP